MLVKLATLIGLALLAAGVVRFCRRHRPADRVSGAWLAEQEQRDCVQPYEGVNWQWPVRKIANEAASWNARRLRKDA